jgi:HNH endonuclease
MGLQHHWVPRVLGGSDSESNLITLCRKCHGLLHSVEWSNDWHDLKRQGIAKAKAAGVKFGRKRKLSDYQREEAIKRRDAGETLTAIAKSYGVHLSMISRLH